MLTPSTPTLGEVEQRVEHPQRRRERVAHALAARRTRPSSARRGGTGARGRAAIATYGARSARARLRRGVAEQVRDRGEDRRAGVVDAAAQRVPVEGDDRQPRLGAEEAVEPAQPDELGETPGRRAARSGSPRASARSPPRSRQAVGAPRAKKTWPSGACTTRTRRRRRARCRSRSPRCSCRPIPSRNARASAAASAGRPAARLTPRISFASSACASARVVRSHPFVRPYLTPPGGDHALDRPPRLVGRVAADPQHRLPPGARLRSSSTSTGLTFVGSRPVYSCTA